MKAVARCSCAGLPLASLARLGMAVAASSRETLATASLLRRVHECVFGVLALESEPIDPRL